tara:strand:+ start:334 stop:600 length:267 start_codon:yes stop_codon:yes gene_type:complete
MDLDEIFKEAVILVQNLNKKVSQHNLLKLYGLYKQSNFGDNNKPKPLMIQTKELYKWEAYIKYKGMSQDDAKKEYSKLVADIIKQDSI